jgi:hypothetical protein
MPLLVADILGPSLATEIPYAGEVLHVTWRPAALTPELEEKANALDAARRDALDDPAADVVARNLEEVRWLVEVLVTIVESWDLLEAADGPPIPIERDRLVKLPTPFLRAVWSGLVDAGSPKATSEAPSPAGSRPRARSARRRTGTGYSRPLGGSGFPRGSSRDSRSSGATPP